MSVRTNDALPTFIQSVMQRTSRLGMNASTPFEVVDGLTCWISWLALQDLTIDEIPLDVLLSLGSTEQFQAWLDSYRQNQIEGEHLRRSGNHPAPYTVDKPRLFSGFLGKWSRLRALATSDIPAIYESEIGTSWRLAGQAPDLGAFTDALILNTGLQVVVTRPDEDEPLGYMASYNTDPRDGYASVLLASLRAPSSPILYAGFVQFITHMFREIGCRKLYFESDQDRANSLLQAFTPYLFKEEGRLKAHSFHSGAYHDKVTFALYHDDWMKDLDRFHSAGQQL